MVASSAYLSKVSDEDILARLEQATAPVAVDVSTSWCLPCKLLAPLLPKLASELGLAVLVLDGDTATRFKQRYPIDGFPELLFFKGGQVVDRLAGFGGYEPLRAAFLRHRALSPQAETPPGRDDAEDAEREFEAAASGALAAFEEATEGPRATLDARFDAVAPELDGLQAALRSEMAAGSTSPAQARQRMQEAQARLFAPFRDVIDAAQTAEDDALATYAQTIGDAQARFAGRRETARGSAAPVRQCGPDDLRCRLG